MLAATSTEPLEADIGSGTALEFRTDEYEHYCSASGPVQTGLSGPV